MWGYNCQHQILHLQQVTKNKQQFKKPVLCLKKQSRSKLLSMTHLQSVKDGGDNIEKG